jgi:hypothetical protein
MVPEASERAVRAGNDDELGACLPAYTEGSRAADGTGLGPWGALCGGLARAPRSLRATMNPNLRISPLHPMRAYTARGTGTGTGTGTGAGAD